VVCVGYLSECVALTRRNGEDLSIWSADDAKKTELYLDSSKGQSSATISTSEASQVVSNASSAETLVPGSTASFTPKGITSGDGVTSSLILNGSRAVGAVVRPYPIATVGTPLRLDFDIASTTFKLQIKVSSADRVPEGVSTEIYLPFVHYAASLEPYTTGLATSESSRNASKASLLGGSTPKSSRPPSPSSKNGADSSSTAPLRLDVDVTVSQGSFDIIGQNLYWKYDVPKTGEQVYTIEVKRRGGAIKRELGYVQSSGGWGEVCPSCVIA